MSTGGWEALTVGVKIPRTRVLTKLSRDLLSMFSSFRANDGTQKQSMEIIVVCFRIICSQCVNKWCKIYESVHKPTVALQI